MAVVPSSSRPSSAGGTARIFAALEDEHDYVLEETEGRLPEGLRGTLYRNGPGRFEAGGQPMGHLFDGDGMLSAFAIDGSAVRFRNRYVRTAHFLGAKSSRGVPQRGIGTLRPGGALTNALRLPANVANTSVVLHAGELLALWEGGRPHALDPDTLETRGLHDFAGKLRWLGAFSAHPKVDPLTGELFNFGVDVLPRPMLRCFRVDPQGRLHPLRNVPIPAPVFNHDVALTERHMVFVIDPIVIGLRDLPAVALGLRSFDRALTFKPRLGTTVVLVPRDGGPPRTLETDALMHFHVNNAFEDGTDTVVDLVRWDQTWDTFNAGLRALRPEQAEQRNRFGGFLTRLRITPSGRIHREELSPVPCEFPQFDWRRGCREHHVTYVAAGDGIAEFPTSVVKHDHRDGSDRVHRLPAGHTVSEPIFVPRHADAAEDDGWLLAVAYDPDEHRSRLLVLDARAPDRDALFVGHLHHHVPQSFHGTFTSRVARLGSD